MEQGGGLDHYRKQHMYSFCQSMLIPLGILFFFAWVLFFRFMRGLLAGHSGSVLKGKIFNALLFLQVALMARWICLQSMHPYALQEWWGFLGHGHGNDLVVNPELHWTAFFVFILICITSFEHVPLVLKRDAGRLALTALCAALIIIAGFSVLFTFRLFRPVSMDQSAMKDAEHAMSASTHFMIMLSAGLFLFVVTGLRPGREDWDRFGWITFLPVLFFFVFCTWCQLKYIYLAKEEYWIYFNRLGGNG
jgi:hypothetical protein